MSLRMGVSVRTQNGGIYPLSGSPDFEIVFRSDFLI